MSKLQELFIFPIVMIDGNSEMRKDELHEKLGLPDQDDEDPELIYGEAQCPYWDFLCINDRWLPTKESIERAKTGIFDACLVSFERSGSFCVAMSKEKFMKKLKDFIDKLPKPKVSTVMLTEEQVKELLKGEQD